jgi:hypothetical protein
MNVPVVICTDVPTTGVQKLASLRKALVGCYSGFNAATDASEDTI